MRWQSAGTVLQAHLRLCFEQFEMNEVRLEPIAINIFFLCNFSARYFFLAGPCNGRTVAGFGGA
jgi:hypothetical protein